jgi:hypothetical protein
MMRKQCIGSSTVYMDGSDHPRPSDYKLADEIIDMVKQEMQPNVQRLREMVTNLSEQLNVECAARADAEEALNNLMDKDSK